MIGPQATKRELFVSMSLDEYVPEDHLLRAVDRYLDLREFRQSLAEGLVQGEGFATDASMIKADAHRVLHRASHQQADPRVRQSCLQTIAMVVSPVCENPDPANRD